MDKTKFGDYAEKISFQIKQIDTDLILSLGKSLHKAWTEDRQVFICGNGGSAANALHIANDLFYGIAKESGKGMRVHAIPANQSILTCLANDLSYEDIFSQQLKVLGRPGDVLIALSGSGNSPNIVKVIESAKGIGMKAFAILGYSGGKCLKLADVPIHFHVDDMQVAEDLQLIVGHMVMQWLRDNPVIK
ncbi:MAG TPA: SIS domain-containing protein [Nitrospirota bacterium]|nr:SIS domain-containing protein [Nitrospirota bacterium]